MRELRLIKEFAPLVGLILIMGGISRTYSYYLCFNIPITSYLQLTETLVLFTDDFIKLIGSAAIILTIFITIFNRTIKKSSSTDNDGEKKDNEIKNERRKKIGFYFITILVSITCYLNFKDVFLTLYFVFFVICLGFLKNFVKREFAYIFIFIWYTSFFGYAEALILKVKRQGIFADFTLDDGRILKSRSNEFFIGKTEKYVFFYNPIKDKSIVVPDNKIVRTEFRNVLMDSVDFQQTETQFRIDSATLTINCDSLSKIKTKGQLDEVLKRLFLQIIPDTIQSPSDTIYVK